MNESTIMHLGNPEKHSFLPDTGSEERTYADSIWAAFSRMGRLGHEERDDKEYKYTENNEKCSYKGKTAST